MSSSRNSGGTSIVRVPRPGSTVPDTGSDYLRPPTSHNAEFSDGGTIADQVRKSNAYITAYEIFSQLSDKSWLNRLLAIPTSVQDAPSTWFDENGLSNKYQDKQNANYQYCIQQIQNLMSEYYAWKNSLPYTQVEQAQVAGFNSAITGNGVDSSQLSPTQMQSDPSALSSTDPLSSLQQFVGVMSSATGGLTSIVESGVSMYKSLRDVERADDKQLFDFYNYLSENGFNIVTSKDGKSIDFKNLAEQYRKAPRTKAGSYKQFEDQYKSATSMLYWSQVNDYFVDDVLRDFVDISYQAAKAQAESRQKEGEYKRDYFDVLDPNNMAAYDEAMANYNSAMSQLRYEQDNKFNTLFWEIVDKWKLKADEGSWIHQDLLCKLLTGYSPYSSTVDNIGAGVGVATDVIESVTKIPGVNKPYTPKSNK